jgi:hypothetical protein
LIQALALVLVVVVLEEMEAMVEDLKYLHH